MGLGYAKKAAGEEVEKVVDGEDLDIDVKEVAVERTDDEDDGDEDDQMEKDDKKEKKLKKEKKNKKSKADVKTEEK
jgi:hypothetical protein